MVASFSRFTFVFMLFFMIVSASMAASLPVISLPGEGNTAKPTATELKSAVTSFKGLSKKDKKLRIKEAKRTIKEYRMLRKKGLNTKEDDQKILLIVLAILLPPLAVYLHQDEINSKFWIALLLTLLFWLPGIIYALIVILNED
jgi:uncharacterized membrane protein YqaE (UPF0057 family)